MRAASSWDAPRSLKEEISMQRKLKLSRETLAVLDLRQVGGGTGTLGCPVGYTSYVCTFAPTQLTYGCETMVAQTH
jgi:hypothetical protein